MTVDVPSLATETDIRRYTSGESHALAIALHRRFGWKIACVTDSHDHFWTDPANPENVIPTVIHVYAVDEAGDYWDIRGKRSKAGVYAELYHLFHALDFSIDECETEEDIGFYVGHWAEIGEAVERPLSSYSEDDLRAAEIVIVRAFPNVPVAVFDTVPELPKFPR